MSKKFLLLVGVVGLAFTTMSDILCTVRQFTVCLYPPIGCGQSGTGQCPNCAAFNTDGNCCVTVVPTKKVAQWQYQDGGNTYGTSLAQCWAYDTHNWICTSCGAFVSIRFTIMGSPEFISWPIGSDCHTSGT